MTIPDEPPCILKIVPFSSSILLLPKFPPARYPPSLVSATEFIISVPGPPTFCAHIAWPVELYFIIIPSKSPFEALVWVKLTPFPKSMLSEAKFPDTIYSPFLVSVTE